MALALSSEELVVMQKLQLEILLELDRICRKHNIKYNLSGGSLLGAVRHKGFIPWDDDIDVRMLREEYEKFCEACKTELDTERYYLQTNVTEEEYRWEFSRILIKGTKYVRVGQEHLKCKTGVFIDLFPSDGYPDSWIKGKYQSLLSLFLRKALWSPVGSKIIKNPIKRGFFRLLNKIPKSTLLKLQTYIIKIGNQSKHQRVVCIGLPRSDVRRWGFSKKVLKQKRKKGVLEGLLKVWMEELIEVPFEGHMVFIPKDYDGWLTYVYGNTYMQLPPEDKRKIHHDVTEYTLCEPRIK